MQAGDVIAVKATDKGWIVGLLAEISYNGSTIVTDNTWRCTTTYQEGWNRRDFNDSSWRQSTISGNNGVWPWGSRDGFSGFSQWIWSGDNINDNEAYFRKILYN